MLIYVDVLNNKEQNPNWLAVAKYRNMVAEI